MLRFNKIEIELGDEGQVRVTGRASAEDFKDVIGEHDGFTLESPEVTSQRDILAPGWRVGHRSIDVDATFYQPSPRRCPWEIAVTDSIGRPLRITIDAEEAVPATDSLGDHLFEEWLGRILRGAIRDADVVERLVSIIAKEAAQERHDLARLRKALV